MATQPTLADVPGILLRTVLRAVARVLFMLTGVVLLIGVALAACSLLIATWRSPRTSRVQAIVDFVLSGTALYKEFHSAD